MINEEQKAIERLKQGRIEGLETLVRLHQLRAIRAAYAITNSREMAEDVAADAFLVVYDRIEQYDASRPFLPWFYRIVVNRARKAVKTASRSAARESALDTALERQTNTEPGPEETALLAERRKLLDTAIQSLPPPQRAALVLRYHLQMEVSEIAQVLACPAGTVKWRLYTARNKLRRTLMKSPDSLRFED